MIEKRKLANEGKAMYYSAESMQWQDRCQFVANLGWLLSQTREGIAGMKLIREGKGQETAIILYNDGSKGYVNVSCNSYAAIVKDVAKQI